MTTPYYLAFQDEAQATSVLYSETTPTFKSTQINDAELEVILDALPLVDAVADQTVTYEGKTYMADAGKWFEITDWQEPVTPNYANIDVIGTVYQPAPDPIPEGYVPVPYPAPNYGVNVLVLDTEDASPLLPYAVQPSPYPQRVWGI